MWYKNLLFLLYFGVLIEHSFFSHTIHSIQIFLFLQCSQLPPTSTLPMIHFSSIFYQKKKSRPPRDGSQQDITRYKITSESSQIEAGQVDPIIGKMSQEQTKESETPQIPLWGAERKPQADKHSMCAKDLAQTHTGSITAASVCVNPMSAAQLIL